MIARRLLMGGGGSFTVPPIITTVLTAAPNGGNNPWTIPGSRYYSDLDKTVLSWVDGSGNIECATYNHATDTLSAISTIHAGLEVDAHDSPALLRRASDSRFITVYSKHNGTPINIRVSTNANDVTAWGAATNLDSQLGATRYTDEQLYEFGSTLYMLYRDEPSAGTDSRWCISTCASSSPTSGWAAQTIVYRVASARSYVISCEDQANQRINFIATNSTASGGPTKLGHFYLDIVAGTYHKSNGTPITLPLAFADITEIYSGTATVFANNVAIDSNGYPAVAVEDTIAGDIRAIYVRFNGTAWSSTNVVSVGTGYEYSGTGTGFTAWGLAVDDGDPSVLWLLKGTSQAEVWQYTASSDWSSFSARQVTSGSSSKQTQLICVRNPHPDLRVFWQVGTWTDYNTWNQGLTGAGS